MNRDLLCVHCGTQFQIHDRPGRRDAFCPGCGALLPVLQNTVVAEPNVPEKKCPLCGELIPPGMDRCIMCGETTSRVEEALPLGNTPVPNHVWLICALTFVPLAAFIICLPVGLIPMLPCSALAVMLAWNNLRAMAGGQLPPKHRWLILTAGVVAGLELLGTLLVFGGYFVNIFLKRF